MPFGRAINDYEFEEVIAGTPQPLRGQVLFVMRFPGRDDGPEYHIQRATHGTGWLAFLSDRYVQTEPLICQAAKLAVEQSAGWHVNLKWHRSPPMGTYIGIKTRYWARALLQSIERWDLPPFTQTPNLFGISQQPPDVSIMDTYAPHGYIMEVGIAPGVFLRWSFQKATKSDGTPYIDVDIVDQSWTVPIYRNYFRVATTGLVDYLRIHIKSGPDDLGPGYEEVYYLYHTHRVNCQIYPAHGTRLSKGQQVYITAKPDDDRFLTDFIVQRVETLPDSLIALSSDEQMLVNKGIFTDRSDGGRNAEYNYGPVTSDVYVGASALGVDEEWELQAGIPATKQMTVNDCYTGTWSIGETDLPESVSVSVDATGQVTANIPEDVYDGLPGGTAYIEVLFEGFSQTVSRVLRLTVLPVPAFGTVWTGAANLDETPKDILLGTDGYVYILGQTKLWKAPTDLSSFVVIPTDGTAIKTEFHSMCEIANGTLVIADGDKLWVKEPTGTQIVRTTLELPSEKTPGAALTGSPASNIVVAAQGGGSIVTNKVRVASYDLGAMAAITTVGIANGAAVGDAPQKGVVLPNGNFLVTVGIVFIGPHSGNYAVLVSADGTTIEVADFVIGPGGSSDDPKVMVEDTGRVYFFRPSPDSAIRIRYSDDNGVTWADLTDLPFNISVTAAQSLKAGYAVIGRGDDIFRTDDSFTTNTEVATTGAVRHFLRLTDRKLLAITAGSGGFNLWKSEA
jgi:hypothetical protein